MSKPNFNEIQIPQEYLIQMEEQKKAFEHFVSTYEPKIDENVLTEEEKKQEVLYLMEVERLIREKYKYEPPKQNQQQVFSYEIKIFNEDFFNKYNIEDLPFQW